MASMEQPEERQSVEHDLTDLLHSLHRYVEEGAGANSEFVADFTKAIHRIGDDLAALQRRVDRLEQGEKEWTTRGWDPPPGADRNPGEAV